MIDLERKVLQSKNDSKKICLIERKPFEGQFSVEGYFSRLVADVKEFGIVLTREMVPSFSKGLIGRMRNLLFVRKLKYDILHVTGDIHYVGLSLPKSRTIHTVHDCLALDRLSGWRRMIMRSLWFSWPLKGTAAITVNSHSTKKELLRHVPRLDPERIFVIPVSVSSQYKPCSKIFDDNRPRILQVGTKPNKNVPRLIEALEGIDCKLVIVGKLSNVIVDKLRECSIDFENHVGISDSELVKQYEECDILGFVSTFEGFGMPIIEAQRVGRAVVSSNCASIPEVAGDGACLVDPLNVSEISAGIKRIIKDQQYREDVIAKGRENCKRFEAREIARQFTKVYEFVSVGQGNRK